MTLQIEAGKTYRTLGGEKVGPMSHNEDEWSFDGDKQERLWHTDGRRYLRLTSDWDTIIGEWDGWAVHNGQEWPNLPPNALVQVRFRDGDEDLTHETVWHWGAEDISDNNWHHSGENDPAEIVAYRVVK